MLVMISTGALSAVGSMTCKFEGTRESIVKPTLHQMDRIYLSVSGEQRAESLELFISDGSTDFIKMECPLEVGFSISDQSILSIIYGDESLPIGFVKAIGNTEYEVTYFHYVSVDISVFPFGVKIDFFH